MAIKHGTVVTLPNNANKQVSANAWNADHTIEPGSISNTEISTSAAIAESKLALNYATHSTANDPSSGQKAAMDAAASPSGGNPFATLSDVPVITATSNISLQLALCPRVVYFVYGDSTDGGTTPDTNTQNSIDALTTAGISTNNIIWIYTPSGNNGSFTFPAVSITPTVTAMSLVGIAAGFGNFTYPSASYVPTIAAMSLTGAMDGSITFPTATMTPTVVAMTLTGASGSVGSFTFPVATMTPTVTAMSLTAGGGAVAVSDDFQRANGGLGANWTTAPSASAPRILNNSVVGEVSTLEAAYYNATPAANQYAQADMIGFGATQSGVRVRQSTTNDDYYSLELSGWDNGEGDVGVNLYVYKCVAGSRTQQGATYSLGLVDPGVFHTIKLSATGTSTVTLTPYLDGSAQGTRTDSSSPLTSGRVGIATYNSNVTLDNFAGGDV